MGMPFITPNARNGPELIGQPLKKVFLFLFSLVSPKIETFIGCSFYPSAKTHEKEKEVGN